MKCPIDETTLTMTERSGIEIDYCPKCRGVWLDRGELDKLISAGGTGERSEYRDEKRMEPRHEDRGHSQPYDSHGYQKKRKKESFLSDLFDF